MNNIFIKRIEKQFGNDSTQFLEALKLPPTISVRKNPSKPTDLWNNAEKVPWCDDGYYLLQKPAYTLDPLFHAGCYYPQEASSMIIDWLLRQLDIKTENPIILDLCAAPGGKATLIVSFLNGNGLLIANEIIKNRSHILLENLIKWGYKNCLVTQNSPEVFFSFKNIFDIIVVDAPCSGEGMFRKDKRAIEEWSEINAEKCALRQRKILDDIWHSLKSGGFLIYSTCTFNPAENEENISKFAKENHAEVMKFTPPLSWGITSINIENGNGFAFYPHLTKGEGFFVTVIQKIDDNIAKCREMSNSKIKNIDFSTLKILERSKNSKNRLIPAHSLAMSNDFINHNHYPELELTLDDALKYLKGEPLQSSGLKKGYLLLKYKGVSLGFGKEIGNRINNLYPINWRIKIKI
ncbi:MAG: RNA methyltransferase [Marinilabiliaceae bacterium]|nr:RNA methyltransferase [Marinilabiliaceae bacterium]